MTTAYEQQDARTYFLIDTDSGDKLTFHYGYNPEDLMCGLVLHRDGHEPTRLGSSVPLYPIQLGRRALLGIDTCFKDYHLFETDTVKSFGPLPEDLELPLQG